MRIEISYGKISGTSALDYSSNMESYLAQSESLISSFKLVKSNTCDLPGGVDTLTPALDEVESRIQQEEKAYQHASIVQSKSNDFLSLAYRVDQRVSNSVSKNQEAFYKEYPHLAPESYRDRDKKWYEKAWDWLCDKGEKIVEGTRKAWNTFTDTVKKAWNGIVSFYEQYKKIIDTVLIVIGTIGAIVAIVATGGTALAPLLGALLGCSTTTAMAISTVIAVSAVVTTVSASTLNIVDTWCKIDNPIFNTFQKTLNITSTVLNTFYSVGSIYNSFKGFKSFKSIDWDGYPDGAPKPKGYYRVLEGNEYDAARQLANSTNRGLHRQYSSLSGLEIHEIHPVKFGGSPNSIINKLFLAPEEHAKYTAFWNNLLRGLK